MSIVSIPPTRVAASTGQPSADRPPFEDSQIEALKRLLAARPGALLSFDCFDTLLWRSVPKPTDVFLLLGQRLRDLGLLRPRITPELFMKMRVVAEQVARLQSAQSRGSNEVKLEEIYAHHGWMRYTGLGANELSRHEVRIESEVTTADPYFKDFLQDLIAGEDVHSMMIVSDTYLDADGLAYLLRSAGLDFMASVPMFLSSDIGVSKGEGLLEKALGRMGVAPGDCIHVGNSSQNDVQPAMKAGVAAVHVPEMMTLAQRSIASEGWLLAGADASDVLDRHAGDSGLTAVRGRIGRRRPTSMSPADAVFWDTGASVLGPMLTGFAEWVHERAADMGIETVLCLMREGQLLAQLVNGVPDAQRTCAAVPFWASREACLRASYFTGTKQELIRLLWRVDPPSPTEMLDALGLSLDDVPGANHVMGSLRDRGTPLETATAFIEFLSSRTDTRDAIVRKSAQRRRYLLDYLQASLTGKGRVVGLVDLGFGATIQEMLHAMTSAEGIDLDFRGLYVFTSPRALVRQLGGHLVDGFLADAGSPRADLTAMDRSPEILECSTTSADGSLLEIGPGGVPVLAPRPPLGEQDRQRDLVQSGIRAFQVEWNHFGANHTLATRKPLGQSSDALHRIMHRFVTRPGVAVAKAFSEWNHDANFGAERTDRLVPEAVEKCIGYLAPENLVMAKATDLYWVGAAASMFGFEEEVAMLQEGKVSAGRYVNTSGGGELQLTAVAGNGASTPLAKGPFVWHQNGRSAIAWSGRTVNRRFHLNGVGGQAVIRLDRVTVLFEGGAVEVAEWDRKAGEYPTWLKFSADSSYSKGLAIVSADQSIQLEVLGGPKTAPITCVEILYAALPA